MWLIPFQGGVSAPLKDTDENNFIEFVSNSFVLAKYKMMILFFKKLIFVSVSLAAGREYNLGSIFLLRVGCKDFSCQ
ncbi:hypothetical protein Bca101_019121 [Brassica carinata]